MQTMNVMRAAQRGVFFGVHHWTRAMSTVASVQSVFSESNTTMKKYVPRRAVLYVPGNDMRKIKKIPSAGADCVVLDCEDGVAMTRKVSQVAIRHALKGQYLVT